MADASSISDWIQAAGVMAALVFTALEVRSRKKEQQFSNYLAGIGGFIDDTRLLVENKNLQGLYDYSREDLRETYHELSEVQRTRVHYCDLILARCETVWVAAREGWIPEREWIYWRSWLAQLGGSPEFRWTLQWVTGDYTPEFIDEVKLEVAQAQKP
jgi:hypothetical protein